jgi:hypothetical protein
LFVETHLGDPAVKVFCLTRHQCGIMLTFSHRTSFKS